MSNTEFTYFIETYGCQMNKYDSELVAGILSDHGYHQAESVEGANIVLVNTCSVRKHAEDRVRGRLNSLRALKHNNGKIVLGVIGCMAERIGSQIITDQPFVDFILGPDSYRALPQTLDAIFNPNVHNNRLGEQPKLDTVGKPVKAEIGTPEFNAEFETYNDILPRRVPNVSAWVAIMRGCDNYCSYCIVPYVRGRERSRPAQSVINEVEKLAGNGFVEVTLLGQNVNSYNDGNEDFADLMLKVATVDGIKRVRFATSHPKDLSAKLVRTIADTINVCNHIHLPVQSGSNKILQAMNRGYTREHYLEKIDEIKKHIPSVSITTDIIIGFPGESTDDFQQTVDLVKSVEFDSCFIFNYSSREGTAAAKLIDDVPYAEKVRRLQELNTIQKEITLRKNERLVGSTMEVLIEGPSKKSQQDVMGRTQSNKIVIIPGNLLKSGKFVQAKIIKTAGQTLFGQV